MAVRRTLPLTSYQRDIWAAESRTPGDPQFNVMLHERLSGEIDVPPCGRQRRTYCVPMMR